MLLGEAAGQGNDENDEIAADEHHDTPDNVVEGIFMDDQDAAEVTTGTA